MDTESVEYKKLEKFLARKRVGIVDPNFNGLCLECLDCSERFGVICIPGRGWPRGYYKCPNCHSEQYR